MDAATLEGLKSIEASLRAALDALEDIEDLDYDEILTEAEGEKLLPAWDELLKARRMITRRVRRAEADAMTDD